MSTLAIDGGAHSVPVVFVVSDGTIVSPIDNKPKQGRELQRVTNITRDPRATLLVDRWDEDWTRLGWVMVRADAEVAPIGDAADLLRARYSQYNDVMTTGERALFLHPTRISWWTWAGTDRADT
jgi:PPOX class probable F420-dependent enzyme